MCCAANLITAGGNANAVNRVSNLLRACDVSADVVALNDVSRRANEDAIAAVAGNDIARTGAGPSWRRPSRAADGGVGAPDVNPISAVAKIKCAGDVCANASWVSIVISVRLLAFIRITASRKHAGNDSANTLSRLPEKD